MALHEGKDLPTLLEHNPKVLVIGSGAGGGVMAKEIAEGGVEVVLVEEGGYYPPDFYKNLAPMEVFKYLYRDYGMTTALGKNPWKDPAVPFPLGKCLGGTTVINSGTCFRTPEKVLLEWKKQFSLPFSEKVLEPYFQKVEKEIGVTEVPEKLLGENALVFARGMKALGIEGAPLKRNAPTCQGSGRCAFGCPTDAKKGTHLTYIPKALSMGAEVFCDLRITHLYFQNGKVAKVEGAIIDREENRPRGKAVFYPKVVVLSAGAVGTPVLLLKNGFKNPHLGKHLRLHPGIRVGALMPTPVQGWKGVPQGYYVDRFWEEQGIMFEGIFVPPSVALPVLPYAGEEFRELAYLYPYFCAFGAMVKDQSEGEIRYHPWLGTTIRYSFHPQDKNHLVFAVKKACEAYFSAGAIRVFPAIYGFSELRSPEELNRIIPEKVKGQHLEMMAFHPMGTCRMASSEKEGVISSQGKVYGIENLYIADASIFPTCLGVNPMESIMALSTYIAEGILNTIS